MCIFFKRNSTVQLSNTYTHAPIQGMCVAMLCCIGRHLCREQGCRPDIMMEEDLFSCLETLKHVPRLPLTVLGTRRAPARKLRPTRWRRPPWRSRRTGTLTPTTPLPPSSCLAATVRGRSASSLLPPHLILSAWPANSTRAARNMRLRHKSRLLGSLCKFAPPFARAGAEVCAPH